MVGNTLSSKSKWYTEPLRRVARIVAALIVVLGFIVSVLNQSIGLVPESMRDEVTLIIGICTAVAAFLVIVQGELGRNGVPGTNFNGMLSPQTANNAMVESAQPVPAVTPAEHLDTLSATLDAATAVDHKET